INPLPRTFPMVCGAATWTTSIAADPAMHISVTPRPYGAVVLAVPRAGGTMTGFAIDDRMDMMTNAAGTKIDSPAFSSVSASIAGARLLATAVDNDAVHVNLLNDDLTGLAEIAKLPGTFTAAVMHADNQTMVPVAGADGLTLTKFDANWNPIATKN